MLICPCKYPRTANVEIHTGAHCTHWRMRTWRALFSEWFCLLLYRTQLDRSVSLKRAHAPIRVKARTGCIGAVCANVWARVYFDNSCCFLVKFAEVWLAQRDFWGRKKPWTFSLITQSTRLCALYGTAVRINPLCEFNQSTWCNKIWCLFTLGKINILRKTPILEGPYSQPPPPPHRKIFWWATPPF